MSNTPAQHTPGAAIVQALDNYSEAKANMDCAKFQPDRQAELSADLETSRQQLIDSLNAAMGSTP